MDTNFRIVCLCGSAGALSGFVGILQNMPADTGMAFLLLTHRRMGQPCWLPEIIARITPMCVQRVENGMALAPNHVYILPPGADMTTDGNLLSLVPSSTPQGWPDTFDIFLKSLAQATHSRAVAVILSGMAGDGSAALDAIRTSGGITCAQTGASYRSMPDTAIDTGNVDFAGSASEISSLLSTLLPMDQFLFGADLPRE
ncbi:MAG TPA: chemotaxis protein CheB [Terracidiphilus sp.]|jgi:two-component system CheB/CheR fusion protein